MPRVSAFGHTRGTAPASVYRNHVPATAGKRTPGPAPVLPILFGRDGPASNAPNSGCPYIVLTRMRAISETHGTLRGAHELAVLLGLSGWTAPPGWVLKKHRLD
jgi:hypothetical protein